MDDAENKFIRFANTARESLPKIGTADVLNMLLSFHFNNDNCDVDSRDADRYPELDFRCLSATMLDGGGNLDYEQEFYVLMYRKKKFVGVLQRDHKVSYPQLAVYYIDYNANVIMLGVAAELNCTRSGEYLNKAILEKMNAHVATYLNHGGE